MKLLIEAPINNLSLGNVTVNILRELHKLGHEVGLFPTGNIDVSTYRNTPEFNQYLQNAINNRYNFLKEDIPSLKIWHLNGADNRKTSRQYLYTFYECNQPTAVEQSIANVQTKTVFSSEYAKDIFVDAGVTNCSSTPLGLDPEVFKLNKTYYPDDIIHFGLMGKFEKRKHTQKIIQTWLKKYGNNPKYQLTCCVTNPFFKENQMKEVINSTLQGKRYTNVNFLPFLKTNAEVNELLNAIDIDLTGLSGGEGWNLPSFNATCIGKWSIVLNATSHKDWADNKNSILVEPSGQISCYDNFFFKEGHSFNQGTFFDWSEESFMTALEEAVKKAKEINTAGIELGKRMTYENTVKSLLKNIV